MFNRLVQFLKKLFQRLFGGRHTPAEVETHAQQQPPPPLTDTDLEFLFTQLIEGVHQARGQVWAQKWLHNIEHRVSTERWVEWLQRFGEKLLASSSPNNELASRMIQLGELEVGAVGDAAYDIGMKLLTRNSGEPIWEYDGFDAVSQDFAGSTQTLSEQEEVSEEGENLPEGEYQSVTLDQLLEMLQQDENLRQQIAQQLGTQTDDPEILIQELLNQFQASGQSNPNQAEA
ncbi:hypothetical protein WA1_15090 [Scytonema hofmannii PCC 7110]|uniref:Uncharacterized protein n=1 Tax=Scytonema hofmannii PCC 7110 TaxID=128403 RepID=A0A139XDC3_9CYAN|nr:hypothetical protein [Scytonema hofmannii]KYC42666.1 hypothetical protein WA1_15090 [Scytonema hofmannii PCC 7110]